MEHLIRLLMRVLLVPLGYLAAVIAGSLVIMIGHWRILEAFASSHPDGPAYGAFGILIGGPVLAVIASLVVFLPASIGILISEAFAIRSWIFHALNGVASAWLGWQLYGAFSDKASVPFDQPLIVVAAGIAGGFAYWAVAGFTAGFWKPVFRRDPRPSVPATTR